MQQYQVKKMGSVQNFAQVQRSLLEAVQGVLGKSPQGI
jgi:hypothetical protein